MAQVRQVRLNGSKLGATSRSRQKLKSPLDKAKTWEVVWHEVSGVFEAARRCDSPTFVYVIGMAEDGPFKIGSAKCPIARLRTMQVGNPVQLKLERVLLGDMDLEKLLHELWAEFSIFSTWSKQAKSWAPRTEWFEPEARPALFPLLAEAAKRQVEYLAERTEEYAWDNLERIVRDVHREAEFVALRRDRVNLVGSNLRSRI